jgi:hypothetical protein
MFVDATHLGGRGAIALSRVVARAVQAEFSRPALAPAPGWIELHDWNEGHPTQGNLSIEDIDQSTTIVYRGWLAR